MKVSNFSVLEIKKTFIFFFIQFALIKGTCCAKFQFSMLRFVLFLAKPYIGQKLMFYSCRCRIDRKLLLEVWSIASLSGEWIFLEWSRSRKENSIKVYLFVGAFWCLLYNFVLMAIFISRLNRGESSNILSVLMAFLSQLVSSDDE